jgi:hypothetical protein
MSAVSRSFSPVSSTWFVDGKCVHDEYHFHGAAREIYSYLRLFAKNHGGFVFMTVDDIVEHTRKWNKGGKPFTKRHCERILRVFRELGVVGNYEIRIIRGRAIKGMQLGRHEFWAKSCGDTCDFTHWCDYESKASQFMGNAKCESQQQDVGDNIGVNVGANVGALTDVSIANS